MALAAAAIALLAAAGLGVLPGPAPVRAAPPECQSDCATLVYSLSGYAAGTVATVTTSGQPDGIIDCRLSGGVTSGTCSWRYSVGSPAHDVTVHVRATTDDPADLVCHSPFFPSDCVAGTYDQTVTFHDDTSEHLELSPGSRGDLSVTRLGSGTGVVTSNPAGVLCGATCHWAWDAGTAVTLTASPVAGSAFQGWGNACTGTQPTCVLSIVEGNTLRVTATFVSAAPSPTTGPTLGPSLPPTAPPTVPPTASPRPTARPTAQPSRSPTQGASGPPASAAPTVGPTAQPSSSEASSPAATSSEAVASEGQASGAAGSIGTPATTAGGAGAGASGPPGAGSPASSASESQGLWLVLGVFAIAGVVVVGLATAARRA